MKTKLSLLFITLLAAFSKVSASNLMPQPVLIVNTVTPIAATAPTSTYNYINPTSLSAATYKSIRALDLKNKDTVDAANADATRQSNEALTYATNYDLLHNLSVRHLVSTVTLNNLPTPILPVNETIYAVAQQKLADALLLSAALDTQKINAASALVTAVASAVATQNATDILAQASALSTQAALNSAVLVKQQSDNYDAQNLALQTQANLNNINLTNTLQQQQLIDNNSLQIAVANAVQKQLDVDNVKLMQQAANSAANQAAALAAQKALNDLAVQDASLKSKQATAEQNANKLGTAVALTIEQINAGLKQALIQAQAIN